MSVDDVVAQFDEAGLRLVRFLWCGNDGTIRAKASGRHGLEGRLERGHRRDRGHAGDERARPAAARARAWGRSASIRLVPDLDTFRVLPYAPHTGAVLTDHMRPRRRRPRAVCQRSFLKRHGGAARRARADAAGGVRERVLARDASDDGAYVPVDSGAVLLDDRDDRVAGLRRRRWSPRSTRSSIPLEQYYAELGHGQQEISTAHAPALQAADEQLLVRETIRAVATGHGLVASLAPKPWPDNAGNGGHVHFSLWEGERNRFYDGDGLIASSRCAFIAGVLEHLPGLCGLTAPSFNSYHRIVPGYWAGAFACWGYDNREAPVRVASPFRGAEEASTNVELKAVRRQLQPVPRARRADRRRARRDRARARAARAGRRRPGHAPRTSARRAASRRCPRPRREALDALAADDGADRRARRRCSPTPTSPSAAPSGTAYSAGDAAFEQQGHFEKY